jgi:hypothetical protein
LKRLSFFPSYVLGTFVKSQVGVPAWILKSMRVSATNSCGFWLPRNIV